MYITDSKLRVRIYAGVKLWRGNESINRINLKEQIVFGDGGNLDVIKIEMEKIVGRMQHTKQSSDFNIKSNTAEGVRR